MPKLRTLLATLAFVAGFAAPLASCGRDELSEVRKDPNMKMVVIPVEGMSCGSCAAKVKRTLKDIPGVGAAVVDLAGRRVTVGYDPRKLAPDRLVGAIIGLGYEPGTPVEEPK